MAQVKENDLMIDFYLSSFPLQQEIINEYRKLPPVNRKSLVHFLEDNFKEKIKSVPEKH